MESEQFSNNQSSSPNQYEIIEKQNYLLKQQISNLNLIIQRNEDQFNRQLGATEYELEQSKKVNQDLIKQHSVEIHSIQIKNQALQETVNNLKDQMKNYQSMLESKQEQFVQMEQYLTKLPTLKEYENTLTQLQTLKEYNQTLEKRLNEASEQINNYELCLGDLRTQIKRDQEKEQILQTQLDAAMERFYSQKSGQSCLDGKKITPIFVEDLQFDLNRYRNAYEHVKKLLEAETCRAEAAETRQKLDKREYDEYCAREEATVAGLKASLSSRRTEIKQLKDNISEINSDKQDLLINLLELRNLLNRSLKLWQTTNGQLCKQLLDYLYLSMNELLCLTRQLNHIAMGEKLDLKDLLMQIELPKFEFKNLKFSPNNFEFDSNETKNHNDQTENNLTKSQNKQNDQSNEQITQMDNEKFIDCAQNYLNNFQMDENVLNESIDQLKQVRLQLIGLRQQLADKYADHLGGKLNCIVQ